MIKRPVYINKLETAHHRSPITALIGPRQCGKTTLARIFGSNRKAEHFDLESQPDLQRLQNPEMVLGSLKGLVILDEIQRMPILFNALRVLVDRPENAARYLILGSASPDLVKNVSETLAGRVEFVELSGFDLSETGADAWQTHWLRGGFPRSYLDILTGTFMVHQLQPWHENIGKRQVKSPKIYLRDSGIVHTLLNIVDMHGLWGHPRIGDSWEGFALSQFMQIVRPSQMYFWSTHSGAELDLFFFHQGRRFGVEFKFSEAPKVSKSMHIALNDLNLQHLWIIYPGQHSYPAEEKISVWPVHRLPEFATQLRSTL